MTYTVFDEDERMVDLLLDCFLMADLARHFKLKPDLTNKILKRFLNHGIKDFCDEDYLKIIKVMRDAKSVTAVLNITRPKNYPFCELLAEKYP